MQDSDVRLTSLVSTLKSGQDVPQVLIIEVDHEDGRCPSSQPRVPELLSRVERGEEILITTRSKSVALLSPYRPPRLTPERQAAIDHAIEVMMQGLAFGTVARAFTATKCTSVMVSFDTNILVYATISAPS